MTLVRGTTAFRGWQATNFRPDSESRIERAPLAQQTSDREHAAMKACFQRT